MMTFLYSSELFLYTFLLHSCSHFKLLSNSQQYWSVRQRHDEAKYRLGLNPVKTDFSVRQTCEDLTAWHSANDKDPSWFILTRICVDTHTHTSLVITFSLSPYHPLLMSPRHKILFSLRMSFTSALLIAQQSLTVSSVSSQLICAPRALQFC